MDSLVALEGQKRLFFLFLFFLICSDSCGKVKANKKEAANVNTTHTLITLTKILLLFSLLFGRECLRKRQKFVWPETSLLAGSLGGWYLCGISVSQNDFCPVLTFPFLLPQLAQVAAPELRQRGAFSAGILGAYLG